MTHEIYAYIESSDSEVEFQTTDGPALTNEWQHVCLRYNGTTLEIYHNGRDVVGGVLATESLIDSEGGAIGGHNYPSNFSDGLIDEVRLYYRALHPYAIQALACYPTSSD